MALIVIRLHPVEPTEGHNFGPYLDGLVVEAFDLSVQDSQLGVSIGTTTYVPPIPPPPPLPGTPWIPDPTTGIVQHFGPPTVIPAAPPNPLAVATAVIEVNAPAGHPEHNTSDIRLKITRGGQEILHSQLYYNVPLAPGGIPSDRGDLPGLPITSLFLALPGPGQEIDPADAYVTVSADGTPPAFQQLWDAVDIVLGNDPGGGNAALLATLTPRQARHVAYEIVWNYKYRPLPALGKRTLAQMYTLPDEDADGGDAAARGQFAGNLQAFYATGDADAERLSGFVLALAAAINAAQRTMAADRVGFLLPVMPNESDTESRFKSVRIVLAAVAQPNLPPTQFAVPAAYFYALGATIPPQINPDERYRLAVLAEEEHTRRALESAIAVGVLAADAAGNVVIDGVNVAQAARRLRSLGAVQGVAPEFAVNGPQPDRSAVRDLVAAWLAYAGDNILTFWRNVLPAPPAPVTSEITGHLELILRALTDGHQPLITAIEGLPATRVQDIHQLTVRQWRDLFSDPIDSLLLPRFTQPGGPADRVAAFIRHVQKFFAVGATGADADASTAGAVPRLRTSAADPLTQFAQNYRLANGADFVFGGLWDADLVGRAVADVFPPGSEPDGHDWLIEAVEAIDALVRLSTSADIPAEARLSVMEALYARGFTDRDQVGRLTADELRAALTGTIAFEYADAVHENGTGEPPVVEEPGGGFVAVNPDGCLVNCVPPEHLSPLGPVAYLHDLLRLTQRSTCASPPPHADEEPTLADLIAGRRGPVGDLRVTAANLGTPLPLIDLVNECLEAVAADPADPAGAVYDTNETVLAGHRLADHDAGVLFAAVAEHAAPATPVARPAGYQALRTEFSAPGLPYAQALDVNRAYLRQLGSSRYDVMRRFRRDITEFAVAPDTEPAGFQRHLWRFPVRIDIAREYLGVSAEEHHLLFGTEIGNVPSEGRLTLHELYGFPAAGEGRLDWKQVVVRLPEFLRRTGLSYCEFLELWRSRYVPFDRAGDEAGFPDCEPCYLDDLVIAFPARSVVAPLRRLAVFIRLWRRLRDVPGAAYGFAELRDICVTLRLFNDDGSINPDFVRQLAALQMLRDSFGIALVDPADPAPAEARDADRTHLLALWVGPAAAKWPWALDELLDQVQVYALETHKCRRRSAEFRKLLADNLGALSQLAGFNADGWHDRPTHTLRFAELLAKIYASGFGVGELIFMGTTGEHLAGDDPFPQQPDNEALGSPLGLPDDETEHSLAALRRALLAAQVTDEQVKHWTWRRIVRSMRGRFGYAPPAGADPLTELAEHFFASVLNRHGHHVPEVRRQFRFGLPGSPEAMWNTPSGPFRYDDAAQELYIELPLTDEAVIAKLSRIRQLDAVERYAVRDLYFQPRAALVPFAFLFADLDEAQRRLIEEPDEGERWAYFRHQFALCHERARLIAEHLAGHVTAATGDAPDPKAGAPNADADVEVAVAVLRSLHGDENRAFASWEDDSGAPPAVSWPSPAGGAFAALLALTGTGLLGEFSTAAGPVWRELRGPTAAFGGVADAANIAVPTVLPALDTPLAPGQQQFARGANGMLFALPDGSPLGGGQGFSAVWSGVLLIDEGGAYEFHAGEPSGGHADGTRWRVVLRRGQRYWVLLSHHWQDESAPPRHSGPVSLRAGAYDLTIEFVQPEPAFEGAADVCPVTGGFQLGYAGPDSGGEHVVVGRDRLFRSHVDTNLADDLPGLDGAARDVLSGRYTGSLRDIRRTYQRAFKAVLFARRFALSAQPVSDGGRSELGYLLGHPEEFSGFAYPPDGAGYTVHRAYFDFDLLPVGDNYHPPSAAIDLRVDPTPRRRQALFDRWERIFDYSTVRREAAEAPEPPVWLMFHENAEHHPDVAAALRRHVGMDARHVPLVLAYAPGTTLTGDDLLDERWTTRVWYAERWLRGLERAFSVDSIAPARPDLWAADDPDNANLTALVRNGFLEHGEPRRYAEVSRLNDGLRARARAALLAYLCGMDRVALPAGGVVRAPKDLSDLLLIDVAVAGCQRSSRIEDAVSAVAAFVQRARLGLEPGFVVSPGFALLWDQRFADFGVWQSWQRRQLYRENWIDWAELARARRSEAFTFLESELRRSTLTVPVAGGLEYWPAPAPPEHPGQLVSQAREPAQIAGIAATHHGFGLLGTPERVGRPTWLSTLTQPADGGDPQPDPDGDGDDGDGDGGDGGDGDGDGGVITLRELRAAGADGRLPLWIQAAVDLGTTFLRVAAAGEPPASTTFAPHHAGESAPCCTECGTPHPVVLDEYYFWLIDSRDYQPPQPMVNGVAAEQSQHAEWQWHEPAELPRLLGWDSGPCVRLAWSRVHNGEFGEFGSSVEGLRVGEVRPQLTFGGRTDDSLRFQVSGALIPIGRRDPTSPGFRYDLATDSAVPLPSVIPAQGLTVLDAAVTAAATTVTVGSVAGFPDAVPYPLVLGFAEPDAETVVVTAITDESTLTVTRGANGSTATAHTAGAAVRYVPAYPGLLPAYPYFVYFAPGASVAPTSQFAAAVTAAAALRAHCQPEAALRWYELAFSPLTSDSSWLRCEAGAGPERENPDSTVAGDDDLRNRSITLHYVETLFELSDAKRDSNTPQGRQLSRLIDDAAVTLLGRPPRAVTATGADAEVRTVAAFEPQHAPLNPRLVALYERAADRLARIHDCLPGRPAPWGDRRPDGSSRQACVDGDVCLAQSPYRFVVLNQKALELAGEVRAMGAALLTAFEKGDAEHLQALRGDHESHLSELAIQVRQHHWREADWQLQALRKTKEITQTRYRHQTLLIQNGLNNREDEHVGLINAALGERTAGNISEGIAQLMGAIPDIFAGFPVTQTWIPLGTKLSGVFTAVARIANVLAEISTTTGGLRVTQAGWERREEEWRHQVEVLGLELEQVELQILAAQRRRDIALRELNTQQRQVENSREVQRFLRGKFTGQELYLFLQQETTALHRQMYELAMRAAGQAQRAYNDEVGYTDATFVPQEAWDHLREGLLAGERLQLGLRQMDHAYLDANHREYELSKHVSLRLDFPLEFLRLQATGECEIDLPEWMFDADHAGHYMRRIKNVSLRIPCVVGPYAGVHCQLTLISSTTRTGSQLIDPPHSCCADGTPGNGYLPARDDSRFVSQYAATEAIATSTGQDDTGLFELNFRDDRKLPFEFAGAVSRWRIELPQENNRFDLDTVSDVVMHLNYTAREGGAQLRRAANEIAQRHLPGGGIRYFDVRHDMPDAWHRLGSGRAECRPELSVRLGRVMFPFLPGRRPLRVPSIIVFIEATHVHGTHFRVEFDERTRHGDHHGGDCRPVTFECVASADHSDLYWGVLDLEKPLDLTGEPREVGVLRFPAGLHHIARTLLFCRYQTDGRHSDERHREPQRAAATLRREW